MVVGKSGASRNNFDDQIISELNHHLLDRVDRATLHKILMAG